MTPSNLFTLTLYKSEMPSDNANMTHFLDKLVTPSVSPEIADSLETPFTLDEVIQSIRSMHSSKAPGPDGFSSMLEASQLGSMLEAS